MITAADRDQPHSATRLSATLRKGSGRRSQQAQKPKMLETKAHRTHNVPPKQPHSFCACWLRLPEPELQKFALRR